MRLAVGGEQAAIEPGEQPELPKLFRQAPPLLPGLVAKAAGARSDLATGRGSASLRRRLPGLPRIRTTLLGRGLRPRIGVSPSKSRADDRQLAGQPQVGLEVNSNYSTTGSIFLWLSFAEEAFIGPTIKLEIEDEHAASKADHQLKQRCAGRIRLQKSRDRHDARTTPGPQR
jgi:hypothetical protein